jgi:hypothetical protein
MSSETHFDDSTSLVNGLRIPKYFDINLFRSVFDYEAQPDDIFIVSYPRSGTIRTAVIVYSLLRNGQPFNANMKDFLSRMPFIDRFGKEAATNMVHPGAIRTHFPFNYVSYNSKSKYIAVIRHPKDVCVSLYELLHQNPESGFSDIDFNRFFELFITGQMLYIDYFEHLRLTWSHKDDENVLLISFEQIKQNHREIILKIAQFLHIDVTNNEKLLDAVETYSSFDYMKKNYDSSWNEVITQGFHAPVYSMKFIRKGIIGDWKSYMTDEQSQRFDAILAEKTRDMKGLEAFWTP